MFLIIAFVGIQFVPTSRNISPAFGAALMSISTIIAAGNAQLLKGSMKTKN